MNLGEVPAEGRIGLIVGENIVIALAGGTAGELDGSRQRSADRE
jgi:hypothetical protein